MFHAHQGREPAMYFTPSSPKFGPILGPDSLGPIDVRADPDGRAIGKASPVGSTKGGVALEAGWDKAGRSLWRLIVHGADVPGRWIVVAREFWPAG
jgi:hypothetical protein